MADTWDMFVDTGHRNSALSFWIQLDAGTTVTAKEGTIGNWEHGQKQSWAGDRNITTDGGPVWCSSRVNNAELIHPQGATACAWTQNPYIHGKVGNLAILDGHAVSVTSVGLLEEMRLSDDNNSVHFLMPR